MSIKSFQSSNLRREANDKEHKFVASLLQLRHVCRAVGSQRRRRWDRQDAGSHRDAEGSGWKVFASNFPTTWTVHIQYMTIAWYCTILHGIAWSCMWFHVSSLWHCMKGWKGEKHAGISMNLYQQVGAHSTTLILIQKWVEDGQVENCSQRDFSSQPACSAHFGTRCWTFAKHANCQGLLG